MTSNGPDDIVPNTYHLSGSGIDVSYVPNGAGPIIQGRGAISVTYQDATRSLDFGSEEVRTVEVPDLGTIVSVTLVLHVDVGATHFSLLVPVVRLSPDGPAEAAIETEGITSVYRSFTRPTGSRPQRVGYTVTHLTGTARNAILPL